MSEKRDAALAEAARRFPERLTDSVRDSIRGAGDPVALQYLLDARELDIAPEERSDPIGDRAHSPVRGIVHRHRDRVLFKIVSVCAVHCRFCFRKEMLGTPDETLGREDIDAALDYIRADTGIREVILTGGDPLVLSPARLRGILERLEEMDHIGILRIHSRVPVADPGRVTQDLCAALDRRKPMYMVIHINHVQEMTPAVQDALERLRRAGVVLLSQSVLLKGVNDEVEALEDLFRALIERRVKPYYLHHPDRVPGTGHFRVSIERGQELMRALRTRLTGLALPTYVLDIPGGHGKVPLDSGWIEKTPDGYAVEDYRGEKISY